MGASLDHQSQSLLRTWKRETWVVQRLRAKGQERTEEQPKRGKQEKRKEEKEKEEAAGANPLSLRGRIPPSRKIGRKRQGAEHQAKPAERSAGLGLTAPWVTPPWREGAWPLIASRDCRTSCPPEERVSLGSRLLWA